MKTVEKESKKPGPDPIHRQTVAATPLIVPASDGTMLEAFGSSVHLHLSGEQTNGQIAVHLATIPPGGGPPPHIHSGEEELFVILEGQFRFLVGDEWTQPCGADTLFYAPRGSRHTFQNAGSTPGRFWGLSTPSGFERFFARCAAVFAQPGPLDIARIIKISAEHEIEYVPPLISAMDALREVPAKNGSLVVAPGEGTRLHAFGDTIQIKLSGQQTHESLTASHYTVSPGGGPPPHRHQHEDELFLIVEGSIRFLINDEWTEPFGAGTTVYLPRGARHTIHNVSETPGHFWIITMPSGFEQFFALCADVFAQPGPPDMARIIKISTEHDIEFVPVLTPMPLHEA